MKIAILGTTGMLGSMVLRRLSQNNDFEIYSFARNLDGSKRIVPEAKNVSYFHSSKIFSTSQMLLQQIDYIINCIGIIKPLIKNETYSEIWSAVQGNILIPHCISKYCEDGTKIIQIATDCVYSGNKGAYVETDPHDALDVYGKTKSLGEIKREHFYNLRCSIIGPEINTRKSLLEWYLSQEGIVNGFTNHSWNGITTLEFANICERIIINNIVPKSLQHIVPSDVITKLTLLLFFADVYKRDATKIVPSTAPQIIDRTLDTRYMTENKRLWDGKLKDIYTMVQELAEFK